MKDLLRNVCTNIYISELFARLQTSQELYNETRSEEDLKEVNRLNTHIQSFFADPANARFSDTSASVKTPRTSKKVFWGAVIMLILIGFFLYSPAKKIYFREQEEQDILVNQQYYRDKTVKDILALQKALTAYHTDNNKYPESSGGWDAVVAVFGESKKDWIPGLAPKYIQQLPTDPRKFRKSVEQYMYKSNGRDYKLISHYPVAIKDIINNHPDLVDPVRPSWAFGVWTDSAKSW